MKSKLVLWGTTEQNDRVLMAMELRAEDNKVHTWLFPEGIALHEFESFDGDTFGNQGVGQCQVSRRMCKALREGDSGPIAPVIYHLLRKFGRRNAFWKQPSVYFVVLGAQFHCHQNAAILFGSTP